jgi:hypothetical protein
LQGIGRFAFFRFSFLQKDATLLFFLTGIMWFFASVTKTMTMHSPFLSVLFVSLTGMIVYGGFAYQLGFLSNILKRKK